MNTIAHKKKRFAYGPFLKALAALAIPVALQNLLSTTGSMVDTMMIADLGENTVAAVGLCASFTGLMFGCYWGFVGGGMLFISQYWGVKDEDGMDRAYGFMWTCMMAVSIIFCFFAVAFPSLVMKLYTDKETIQAIGIPYVRIAGLSYPMIVFTGAAAAFLRSTERVRIPLVASIASVITNVVLNYILIYGKLGLPAMGVEGAAWATVIASFVNISLILILAKVRGFHYLFEFKKHFTWSKAFIKEFFQKTYPIIINEVGMGIGNGTVAILFGHQAEHAIAAVAVFNVIEGLFIGFFEGFSSAASVLVGKKVGAGELDEAYDRANRIVYICSGIIGLLCIILLLVRTPLLGALGLSGDSLKLGYNMAYVFSIAMIFRLGNWCHNDTFRAAGDPVFGTVLEVSCMFVAVIPLMLLAIWLCPELFLVVYIARYFDEPIRYIFMQIHIHRGKFIRPVTEQGMAALPAFKEKHHIR